MCVCVCNLVVVVFVAHVSDDVVCSVHRWFDLSIQLLRHISLLLWIHHCKHTHTHTGRSLTEQLVLTGPKVRVGFKHDLINRCHTVVCALALQQRSLVEFPNFK